MTPETHLPERPHTVDEVDAPPTVRMEVPADGKDAAREYRLRVDRSAEDPFPKPGEKFLAFRLVEEIGRGAFGRVFLAHQGDLAGRPVALKVARNIFDESQTLAQFQHSHIVPIYSYHRVGSLQAVCMPYLGRTTLADVVANVGGRVCLPQTGRELKSTLNRHSSVTATSSPSDPSPVAQMVPSTVPELRGTVTAPEGWDWLDGLSYVEAVLKIGSQMADGLAHAHRHGILHRDLKPANVLLTDDGRAMLLDFNLAQDTKPNSTARAAVGGTLPYMAPEQLFRFLNRSGAVGEQADVYALGVILFELLTGKHPYSGHAGAIRTAARSMLSDRLNPPPSPRTANPAVSPAVAAIVRKCLEPDPDDRYLRAEDLKEDLDRQLTHRRLKFARDPSIRERLGKWTRRHPRLTSSSVVAATAAGILIAAGAGTVAAVDRARTLDARAGFADHRAQFANVQLFLDDRNQSRTRLDEAMDQLNAVLDHYGATRDDAWLNADSVRRLPAHDRAQLLADMGETFFRMADVACLQAIGRSDRAGRDDLMSRAEGWNVAAERLAGDRIPLAVRQQKTAISALRSGRPVPAIDRDGATTARDLALVGGQLAQVGRHRDALAALRQATQLDPSDFSAWFVRGTIHLDLEQNELAAMSFGACLALRPTFAPAWRNRGLAFSKLRFFDQALDDYDRAIALDPLRAESFLQRAAAKDTRGDSGGAEADYTAALTLGSAPVRTYFLRADIRERRGNAAGARADQEEGLRLVPADELSWIGRAEVRVESDPTGALADVHEALKINPASLPGMQLKAHILAERLHRPAEALATLDRAVERYPESASVRAGRGVIRARQGNRTDAVQDAKDALLLDGKAPNLYQVGCIYALTARTNSDDKREALRLLWAGLKTGFGLDIVDTDSDLDSIRSDPEFNRLIERARLLHPGLKK